MSASSDLDALRREADDIVNRARDLLQSWIGAGTGSSVKDLSSFHLAHYTSLEAIVAMLQTPDGGLRLSDTSTMNDPDEGRATVDGRVILHFLENEFGTESWLRRRYGAAHVCCFVGLEHTGDQDAGDDLLFWRLYGNDCRGVSITIPPLKSKPLAESGTVDEVMYTDGPSLNIDTTTFATFLKDVDSLRARARDSSLWSQICTRVLPVCDLLFKQRFLRKRAHYGMEREYRAVAFLSGCDAEDSGYSHMGRHVQYARVRRFVQIPELSCESIFTSGSRIAIGSNVPEVGDARDALRDLLNASSVEFPDGVAISTSSIRYRTR